MHEKNNLLKGMISGMIAMGAEFVKCDGIDIFFKIPDDAKINNHTYLTRARDAFLKEFGYTLKIFYKK